MLGFDDRMSGVLRRIGSFPASAGLTLVILLFVIHLNDIRIRGGARIGVC